MKPNQATAKPNLLTEAVTQEVQIGISSAAVYLLLPSNLHGPQPLT